MRDSFFLLGLLFTAVNAFSQSATPGVLTSAPYEAREHYTKYEYRVPMRDGVRLLTAVHVPKDSSKTSPFLVMRTPYGCGPYGVEEIDRRFAPTEDFARAGYIFVCQDVRGRNMSEGTFIEVTPHRANKVKPTDVDESSDMFDSVEWLLKNVPNHNGKVGIWGISYPGFYTAASIIDSHPAIKAASPQAPMADEYMGDDAYHGGAFMLAANYGFYTFFKPQNNPTKKRQGEPFDYGTRDAYDYFLRLGNLDNIARSLGKDGNPYFEQAITHPTYDEYWQVRALPPRLKNIKAAVLTVGGWFDGEDLQGPLSTYRAIEAQNPGIWNGLVMGPWTHGGWLGAIGRKLGHVDFAARTSDHFQKKIMLPFFEQHLKGAADANLPEAIVFETGTNVWRLYPSWPPKGTQARTLFFHADGKLAWTPPTATEEAFDQYLSDPAKPVPFIAYNALNAPAEFMASDQRFAATRPDVLVWQSEVLEEDVTLVGPVAPRLFAATSGTDADWVVKLIDVYPPDLADEREPRGSAPRDIEPPRNIRAGYQQLVRGDPLRARYRNGFERPEASVPGKVEEIRFTMPDVNHTFRRGHRIMVQVQSSWFPLIDRNPQTFVRIRDAKPTDFRAAVQQVHRSATRPSGVGVLVLGRAGM